MTIKRIPVPEGLIAGEQQHLHVAPRSESRNQGQVQSTTPAKGVDERRQVHRRLNAGDGTKQLLVSGFWTMLVGLVSGALAMTVLGGFDLQGAHSNAGWLAIMVAMMCTPFAVLLLLLGIAKWLRNSSLSRSVTAHRS